jgi:chromosome segregation ATPase
MTFSPADVSNTTAIWARSNVICYSTDLSEKNLPPLHTAEEATQFLLWHGVLIASVFYLICWVYCQRTVARVIKNETLSMDDLVVQAIGKAETVLTPLKTANRQRDELLVQNGELLEEHARQEVRVNEVDDARTRLEEEVADLKNELRAADERREKDREEDEEWDVKFDCLVVENSGLKNDVAALTRELMAEKEKPGKSGDESAETQDNVDLSFLEAMRNVEMKRLQDEVARLTAEMSRARQNSTTEIIQMNDALEKAMADHKKEKDMLTKGMAVVVSAEKKSLQDEIARLTVETERLSNDLTGIATEKNELQNEVDILIEEKNQFQNALVEVDTERDELQKSVGALKKKNVELQENVDSLTVYIDKLQSDSRSPATADAEPQQSPDNGTVENEKLQNDVNGLATEIIKLQGELDNAIAEKNKPQGYLNDLNPMVEELQNDVKQLTTENQALRNDPVETKDLQDLTTKLSEVRKAREENIAQINQLTDQLASTQNEINSMFTQEELEDVQNELNNEHKKDENLQGDLEFLHSKIDSLELKLKASQKKLDSATQELKSKTDELKFTEKTLRVGKGTTASLKAALDSQTFGMQQAKQMQEENVVTIGNLQGKLKDMKKETEGKTKELEADSTALRELTQWAVTQSTSEVANEQLKATVSRLTAEIESKKAEIAYKETKSKEHLETCQGPSANANQEDNDLFGPIPNEKLLDERDELLKQLETAKNDNAAAEASRQELLAQLSLMEQELTNTRAEDFPKTQEINRLQRQVDKQHRKISMRNQKITRLEEELERANGAADSEENGWQTRKHDAEGSMDGMEEIGSDSGWYEEQIHPIAQPRRSRSPSFEDETESKRSNDFEEADPEDILKEFMEDAADDSSTEAALESYSAQGLLEAFTEDPTGDFLQWPRGQQQPVTNSTKNWGDEESYTCPACNEQVYVDLKEVHDGVCKGGVANDPNFDILLV